MSEKEHITRLLSIWAGSPGTRSDIERRYPGLAWAIDHVLNHEAAPVVAQMNNDRTALCREAIVAEAVDEERDER